jgi:hypothetical protein
MRGARATRPARDCSRSRPAAPAPPSLSPVTARWYASAVLEREIHTEIDIEAPPEAVWAVLSAIDAWSEWNPVIGGVKLDGPLREGTRGRLTLTLPRPLGRQTLTVRLATVLPARELAWKGGVPGVVQGRHGFRLEPTATGTRLVHTEVFSGVLAPVLVRLLRGQLGKGYRRLNHGLRNRCEGGR